MSALSPLCNHERTWEFGSEHSRPIHRDTACGVVDARSAPISATEQRIPALAGDRPVADIVAQLQAAARLTR